ILSTSKRGRVAEPFRLTPSPTPSASSSSSSAPICSPFPVSISRSTHLWWHPKRLLDARRLVILHRGRPHRQIGGGAGRRRYSIVCLMEPKAEARAPGADGSKRRRLKLEALYRDHYFVRELPGDPRTDTIPRQYLHLLKWKTLNLKLGHNQLLSCLIWIRNEFVRPDFPIIFAGALPLKEGLPYAQCYGGHQFGRWAGQLGDGRAITLDEILNSRDERWELQLKGAGKTPYSRFADGLVVLHSSICEFLCSEAMNGLGIPTTRALCLVATGKFVTRDMFYYGNPRDEPGAIVCHVAQSFLRFGSYQIHASRGKEDLDIVGVEGSSVVDLTSNKYAETTCGFLDAFDPRYTPNATDLPWRRYCFANQPDIGLWNIGQFTATLSAAQLISNEEANYAMERKLGLSKYNQQIKSDLLNNMATDQVDYTNFFWLLSSIKADTTTIPNNELPVPLKAVLLDISQERKEAWASFYDIQVVDVCFISLITSGVAGIKHTLSFVLLRLVSNGILD
ncbi:G-type lectin S-receptor-like serine threonine-protein kinase, partial [Musa troglodytarum]